MMPPKAKSLLQDYRKNSIKAADGLQRLIELMACSDNVDARVMTLVAPEVIASLRSAADDADGYLTAEAIVADDLKALRLKTITAMRSAAALVDEVKTIRRNRKEQQQ